MSYKKRPKFYDSDEAREVEKVLRNMQDDSRFNTDSSYSADTVNHPDHLITFTEKHMAYLQSHPDVNPTHYIANLRLMTKDRTV